MIPHIVVVLTILCYVVSISAAATKSDDPRIKHVVVLMLENRPFDHIFGWASDLLGVDGLSGDEYNLVDPNDVNSERIYVNNKAPFLNECDPAHSTPSTTAKLFSTNDALNSGIPDMGGFVHYQNSSASKNYCNVMSGFPPSGVPIITKLAQEYAVFDRFFASHPGPTWPNRMFALSGTSAGSTETSVWYHGTPGKLYPQKTIFDQITETGKKWANYHNDTPWELILESVAHSPHNLKGMDEFYKDAEQGTLPDFSWLNPRSGMNVTTGVGSNDQHPDHDVTAGEQYMKDIYEALRAGKAWEETLFIITYDEHGGIYDHVVPPTQNIPPPNDGEVSYPDKGFKFDRLGIRIPTLLISPWIKKGTVLTHPPDEAKPAPNSEYELTSIIASTRKLLNMDIGPLTDRDAWSATFDHALYELDEPRSSEDCPMHLPESLQPALPKSNSPLTAEQDKPLNDLQIDIASVMKHLGGHQGELPQVQGHLSDYVMKHFDTHKASTIEWLQSKEKSGRSFSSDVVSVSEEESSDTELGKDEPKPSKKSKTKEIASKVVAKLPGHVDVVAKERDYYVGATQDKSWALNGEKYGSVDTTYANANAPYITLSTVNLKGGKLFNKDSPYCLDGGKGTAGSSVKASLCYPSPDPDTNRDPMQHFRLHPETGTLRLYNKDGDTLCVTNHIFDKYERRLLREGESMKSILNKAKDKVKSKVIDKIIDKANDVKDAFSDSKSMGRPKYVTLEECDGSVQQTFAYHGKAPGDSGAGNLEFGDVEFYLGVEKHVL